jgi:hypothetical protein
MCQKVVYEVTFQLSNVLLLVKKQLVNRKLSKQRLHCLDLGRAAGKLFPYSLLDRLRIKSKQRLVNSFPEYCITMDPAVYPGCAILPKIKELLFFEMAF